MIYKLKTKKQLTQYIYNVRTGKCIEKEKFLEKFNPIRMFRYGVYFSSNKIPIVRDYPDAFIAVPSVDEGNKTSGEGIAND